ncbi:hypothetical protein BCH_02485 [Brucella sp. 191011898]|nr:hypothetical protein BCH_02485 [Brucella sp. 191011898]
MVGPGRAGASIMEQASRSSGLTSIFYNRNAQNPAQARSRTGKQKGAATAAPISQPISERLYGRR